MKRIASSFRDPGGFVFTRDGTVYRQINEFIYTDYQHLMDSGLYKRLVSEGLLIPHKEVPVKYAKDASACVVLKPDCISHISYPYEWCFSQLKDAALLTLKVNRIALEYDMVLKDATAYNIQFHNGSPILIDTCSLTTYYEGEPWSAYQQFCKHFLAPLVLMVKVDIRLNFLSKVYIDGVPLDLASRLLPVRTWLSFSILAHIHAHAKSQAKFGNIEKIKVSKRKVSRVGLLGLLDNLESAIKKLAWMPANTEWGDYYKKTNYSNKARAQKVESVRQLIGQANPKIAWDLGGNNGFYSRLISDTGASVVSWDIDPVAVESNYIQAKLEGNISIIPLIQDLTNPSASIGWANKERESLQGRGPVDLIMALALIHHLAISNNVPFEQIAKYFSQLGKFLLIEFVPKEDSQVKHLLASRVDIFTEYTQEEFKRVFSFYFEIIADIPIVDSERHLFLMKKKKMVDR